LGKGRKGERKRSKLSRKVQKENGELRHFETVERWLRDLRPANHYLYSLRIFTRKTGLDPDQFLAFPETHKPVEVWDLIEKTAQGEKDSITHHIKVDMRSFLHHNGINNLPKAKITYTLKDWHRGYRKEEVRELDKYLDSNLHKLPVYAAVESGLRIRTVLAIHYKHIKEDLEAGVVPVAIRFGPEFYHGGKTAGYTFLGPKSIKILKALIADGTVKTDLESPIVPRSYQNLYKVIMRAAKKAKLDSKIQVFHGLRKYFEDSLNAAGIDQEIKMVIEGRLAGVNAKHYTDRDWETFRANYRKAYPHIDFENVNPELEKREQDLEGKVANLEKQLGEVLEELRALKKK